jgi:hypothetical protein
MQNLLTKTTINYAKKRNVGASLLDLDDMGIILSFYPVDSNSDAELNFILNEEDGSFSFATNTLLEEKMMCFIPRELEDENHIRKVVNFLSGQPAMKEVH